MASLSEEAEGLKWAYPTTAVEERLSTEQLESWRNHGFTLVQDLIPLELLTEVKKDALTVFPAPTDPKARSITDFGGGVLKFPSEYRAINKVALHENLIETVAELLGVHGSGKCLFHFTLT